MTQPIFPGIPPAIEFDQQNRELIRRVQECLAHPLAESFRESLERLAGLAHGGKKVRLGLDFSPLSFGFAVIRPDGSAWICGGLLYHGVHDRGGDGGGPTYAVCLTPTTGWSIHT